MKNKDYDIQKHITLSKEKTFVKSYDSIEETDLSNSEKKFLNYLISFGVKNKKITPSINYLTKRLNIDDLTLRSALRNFQIRGLIKLNREPGKANEITLNKEYINRFLGCKIFQENTPNKNNNGRTGGAPSADYLKKINDKC